MVADIQALQSQGGNGGGALNGETHLQLIVRKPEAGLVDQMIGYRVIVRNDEIFVVLQVGVCRQEIIHRVKKAVGERLRIEALPAPAHEEGLLGSEGTVDANVVAIGIAGSCR